MTLDTKASISVTSAAKLLGVHRTTIYKMVYKGELENISEKENKVRIDRASLEKYVINNDDNDKYSTLFSNLKVNPSVIKEENCVLKIPEVKTLEKLGIKMSVLFGRLLTIDDALKLAINIADFKYGDLKEKEIDKLNQILNRNKDEKEK